VPIPSAPLVFTAILSYFIAGLFMDIFDLAVLTFMFARDKNASVGDKFGPDATSTQELEDGINEDALSGAYNKKEMDKMRSVRKDDKEEE